MLKLLLPVILISLTSASAQQTEIILSCNPSTGQCDTSQINEKDVKGMLARKFNKTGSKNEIRYIYDVNDRLIRKEHYDSTGQLYRINRLHHNEQNWDSDSLLDIKGHVLLVLQQSKADTSGLCLIKWYLNNDSIHSAEQRIMRLSDGSEMSNSTCYSANNCITYIYQYTEGRKIRMETWVLLPEFNSPLLTESEEYAYDEYNRITSTIRFLEPDHRNISILRHYYYPIR